MSDDLDDQIRHALKTLDSQVPSGYFEDLPSRTLARLEQDMQTTEGNEASAATSQPGMPAQHEEDSGLHDIRNLASSQRMSLVKRTSQNPIIPDEDVLASTSAGWKAVALPEPAKVVSLPELRESQKKLEFDAPRPIASHAKTEPVRTKKSGGKGIIAVVGLGLAAAAGVTLFMMNNQDASDHAKASPATVGSVANGRAEQVAQAPAARPTTPPPTPTVQSVPAIATSTDTGAAQGSAEPPPPAAAAEVAKVDTSVAAPERAKVAVMGKKSKPTAPSKEEKPVTVSKAEGKAGKKSPEPAGGAAKGSGGEPATGGLDDLLKEAGVQQKQSPTDKPKLDKKSLDGSDIRTAMSAVQGKAQACYAGQQGTASVKLSVAPNGKVQKVTVTGVFAGTPVAACVAAAVKGATFPPWDGAPQTVSYSYLLSE